VSWRPIDSAPHDGSEIWLRVEHMNFAFAGDDAEERELWQQTVDAHWIDHNGGGFTWHGLAGTPTHWQPKDGNEKPSPELLQP
jgi:hypothetical protein